MVPGIVPDLLQFLLLLWLFDAVALSPVLVAGAVRRLVRQWPTDSLAANYLVATAVYAVSHLLVILVPVFVLKGGSLRSGAIAWIGGLTLANLVLWWLALSIAFPLAGLWQPNAEGEYDGRVALTLGLVSYTVATAALAFLALVIVIMVGFPG